MESQKTEALFDKSLQVIDEVLSNNVVKKSFYDVTSLEGWGIHELHTI